MVADTNVAVKQGRTDHHLGRGKRVPMALQAGVFYVVGSILVMAWFVPGVTQLIADVRIGIFVFACWACVFNFHYRSVAFGLSLIMCLLFFPLLPPWQIDSWRLICVTSGIACILAPLLAAPVLLLERYRLGLISEIELGRRTQQQIDHDNEMAAKIRGVAISELPEDREWVFKHHLESHNSGFMVGSVIILLFCGLWLTPLLLSGTEMRSGGQYYSEGDVDRSVRAFEEVSRKCVGLPFFSIEEVIDRLNGVISQANRKGDIRGAENLALAKKKIASQKGLSVDYIECIDLSESLAILHSPDESLWWLKNAQDRSTNNLCFALDCTRITGRQLVFLIQALLGNKPVSVVFDGIVESHKQVSTWSSLSDDVRDPKERRSLALGKIFMWVRLAQLYRESAPGLQSGYERQIANQKVETCLRQACREASAAKLYDYAITCAFSLVKCFQKDGQPQLAADFQKQISEWQKQPVSSTDVATTRHF